MKFSEPTLEKTGNNIKIPEGRFSAWERIGLLNTNAGQREFYSGQSDKYHLDLSFTDESNLKVPIIESKINFNNQTGHHEFDFHHPDEELFQEIESQNGFNIIYDNYLRSLNRHEKQFLETLDKESHVHKIYNHKFKIDDKERVIELIHQTRGGDCVLANLINTISFESDEGNISLTIKEARELAVRLRQERKKDTSDILSPDSALETEDVLYLFYEKFGTRDPMNTDYMNIDGNVSEDKLEESVLNILVRLQESNWQLCSVGMQIHSISIKYIPDGTPKEYIVIDPLNRNGLQFFDILGITNFIKSRIRGQTENNNFFCFVN